MLQQFPYAEIVLVYGLERQQLSHIGVVAFQYLQCLGMKRYSDYFCLAFLCLLRHILQKSVLDVVSCQSVQITHTAADIAMEHEYIPNDSQFRVVVQICIIQDIPFFGCQIERIAVCRFLTSVKLIYLVVGILHFLAPVEKSAEEVHRVDDGRVRQWSWSMIDKQPGRIEVGVLLT